MGLTIHYHGQIKDTKRIPAMVAEVIDICESLNWRYQTLPMSWKFSPQLMKHLGMEGYEEIKLTGIMFCPHEESEWVYLYFSQNGRLAGPPVIQFADLDTKSEFIWYAFTKMQMLGHEAHMGLIKLLRYLDKKYELNFKLIDEGEYWETEDEKKLMKYFEKNQLLMDMVTHALDQSTIQPNTAMTPLCILRQIEEILKEIGKGPIKEERTGTE